MLQNSNLHICWMNISTIYTHDSRFITIDKGLTLAYITRILQNWICGTEAVIMWMNYLNIWINISHNYSIFQEICHGFVVLCFVVVMQSFIMNSNEEFIHIHQGCFAGTGAIVRLPQCQWSKPDGYGKTSQCITTTKHSKAKTVCIFPGIYCTHVTALSSRNSKIKVQA